MILEDAIRLTVRSRLKNTHATNNLYANTKTFQISVTFEYDGKVHTKLSSEGGIYILYADKELDIAYSPKYDEVFILKS